MRKTNENPGIASTLPHPVLGAAEKEKKAHWDYKVMLGLLMDALHKECKLDPCDCDLLVRDRIAYVQGTVANLAQKRAVTKAAQTVPGLRAVVNSLRIAPLAPRSDQHIASDVRDALTNAGIMSHLLEVKVLDGVVHLFGAVCSPEACYTAEDAAWSVRGVQDVVCNITVATLCPRPDEALVGDAQLALSRCLGVEISRIQVEVRGGIAHLRGQVNSQFQKLMVEDAVRWIPGIMDVVNEVSFSSPQSN
ncbi:MAG: BON domain-containing protein [Dehalococcoidia bacterium]|nr:BON domain-containing protein [Dehalococcoidia bacterium]